MPNNDGKLTVAEQEIAKKWLTQKEAVKNCPACGFQHWTIIDQLALVSQFTPGGFLVGGGFPAVMVICNRCAYMRLHNAVAMGLVSASGQEDEEAKDGGR